MCRILEVTPSGYYAWLKQPLSHRAAENARLLQLIRGSFAASNGIYDSPRVLLDLREVGETCSKYRVARRCVDFSNPWECHGSEVSVELFWLETRRRQCDG